MNNVLGDLGIALAGASLLLSVLFALLGMARQDTKFLRYSLGFAPVAFAGIALSFAVLERALINRDFEVLFVAEFGSSRTSRLFNFTALWSGLEGSILLWALVLLGFILVFALRFRQKILEIGKLGVVSSGSLRSSGSPRPLLSSGSPRSSGSSHSSGSPLDKPPTTLYVWAYVVVCLVGLFFIGLLVGPADPFVSFSPPVGYDGPGPDPLLQSNLLMAIHPPMLYLGYVGFTIPFAFAVAALISGNFDRLWLKESRTFTLLAWGFLTVGIVLGAWWSYDTLGWGGYWGWDPVENASLLPWLCGTAFLHSAMAQESRGILVVWNLSLICATFNLTILGTFLTRSGVLVSVHSFTESAIGPIILGFFAFTCASCVGLLLWRASSIKAGRRLTAPLNRTASLVANNFVFAAFALVVLLGTMFPLLSEALTGDQVSVGAPYFNQMTTPLGLLILFLMSVSPLLPWGEVSQSELGDRLRLSAGVGTAVVVIAVLAGLRGWAVLAALGLAAMALTTALRRLKQAVSKRGLKGLTGRSGGGMVAHVGLVIIAIALTASGNYLQQDEVTLAEGESITVAGYEIELVAIFDVAHSERLEQRAVVQVDGRRLAPSVDRFFARGRIIANPDTANSFTRDVQVSIVSLPGSRAQGAGADLGAGAGAGEPQTAVLRVTVQPMVSWLWIGGGVMAVGVLLCLWPRKSVRQQASRRAYRRERVDIRQEASSSGEASRSLEGSKDGDLVRL